MLLIRNASTKEKIGLVDKLKYIQVGTNGHLIIEALNPASADGIVYQGIAYNIDQNKTIPNAPLVEFEEVDTGLYVQDQSDITSHNTNDILTLQQVILLQDNYIATLEEALMDLDNAMTE